MTTENQVTPEPVEEATVEAAPTEVTENAETPTEEPEGTQEAPTEPESTEGDEPTDDAGDAEGDEPSTETYQEYDDPALSQMVDIFTEADLPVDEANAIFAEALDSNDLAKVDTQALVDKLGQRKADLVMLLATTAHEKAQANLQQVTNTVHDIVGGEEAFKGLQAWVADKEKSDTAFASEMLEIREMIDSGKERAVKAAINDLFSMYKKDPNVTLPANITQGDGSVGSTTVEPLTRLEYADAVDKARRAGTYEKEQATLWARRKAGKQTGI